MVAHKEVVESTKAKSITWQQHTWCNYCAHCKCGSTDKQTNRRGKHYGPAWPAHCACTAGKNTIYLKGENLGVVYKMFYLQKL